MREDTSHNKVRGQPILGNLGGICKLCNTEIFADRLKVSRIFSCNHVFHLACLNENESDSRCFYCESIEIKLHSKDDKKKKRQSKKKEEQLTDQEMLAKMKSDHPLYDS